MSLSIKSQPIATLAIADVRSDNNFPESAIDRLLDRKRSPLECCRA